MSRRFEQVYRVKRRDNLGDPEYWNKRWDDIDRRVDANEMSLESLDAVADRVEGAALSRINDVVTPLVEETISRVRSIPAMFSARSSSNVTISAARLIFVIDAGERNTFAALAYATVDSADSPGNGVVGKVVSYDVEDGELVIDVLQVIGTGTFNAWNVTLSAPPDLVHATRVDNPHKTTAAQVGAYTKAEVDQKVATAVAGVDVTTQIDAIVAGAPAARNTLKKISDLYDQISNSLNQATSSFNDLLLKRLRVDADQGFTSSEKGQGLRNLGLQADAASRVYSAGDIRFIIGTNVPAGWIKANGGVLTRSGYPDLWAYAQACGMIATEANWNAGYYGWFSNGDGTTTFRVPDLRGGFIRAHDDGRGVDSGRTVGVWQGSQNLSHGHGASTNTTYMHAGGSTYWFGFDASMGYVPVDNYNGVSIGASGGSEARPVNLSLLAIMKI